MNKEKTHEVALGFGSDLGDTEANIKQAILLLEAGGFKLGQVSSFIRTAAVDCLPGTPDFTNCCAIGSWSGTPEALLNLTQSIEIALGRPAKHSSHEARLIDIDILTFGNEKITTPRLTIPHPRMMQRDFVLIPLRELGKIK